MQVTDRDDHDLDERRFMVVVWGPGGQGPSTTVVMLDHQGAAIDFLYCGSLSGAVRKPFGSEDELDYAKAMEDAHKVGLTQPLQPNQHYNLCLYFDDQAHC